MHISDRSPDPRRAGARVLDTAEGVLIALCGCTLNQAFVEIVQTAKRHNVSTLSLADALAAIAQTRAFQTVDDADAALVAARATWATSSRGHRDNRTTRTRPYPRRRTRGHVQRQYRRRWAGEGDRAQSVADAPRDVRRVRSL